ncbi:MAG TPA: hypothetical protein DCQ93_04010 [Bacteroidetes bacterium]|nr:hypothetical protein [Bacteroidota bacterium]
MSKFEQILSPILIANNLSFLDDKIFEEHKADIILSIKQLAVEMFVMGYKFIALNRVRFNLTNAHAYTQLLNSRLCK